MDGSNRRRAPPKRRPLAAGRHPRPGARRSGSEEVGSGVRWPEPPDDLGDLKLRKGEVKEEEEKGARRTGFGPTAAR